MQPTRQFLLFAAIGAAAFLVDAGALLLLTRALAVGPYAGRAVSWLCAATFTWALNRRYTFPGADRQRPAVQWLRFLAANALGGAVNYGVYAALVAAVPLVARHLVLGVAAGSGVGLIFNFLMSRAFVFGRAGSPP